MIKSSVTISLVPEAKGGPFVYWDDLPNNCAKAAELGFDGVEIFPRSTESVDKNQFQDLLSKHNLQFAAMGTGAGMLVHNLSLTSKDIITRNKATEFIKSIIDFAGNLGAPAIIGSMQGRHGNGTSKEQAIEWLSSGLNELGEYANQYKTPLLYEPLNRYETNLFNTIGDTVRYLNTLDCENIKILADLFHMNIEEKCIHQAIQNSGNKIGHVHFVDSNRHAAGFGHMNHKPISEALNEIGFDQFVSAEAFPLPNSDEAAKSTISSFNKYFR